MLRVTVDIVPGGFEPLRRKIASMTIANITNLAAHSDYAVDAMEGPNPLTGQRSLNTSATIYNHDRASSVWVLIAKAAAALVKAEG